ncbi:zinc finger-containing ubiquitin peptidase 1 isoform X3 [Latimeria chalumnae]|uniref:zinc finger-containing ubiquitin peptidase 1 isoform X3 n=1 Tax=Latimeria chalumnae TaxID=7897 RepID=UPI00313BF933
MFRLKKKQNKTFLESFQSTAMFICDICGEEEFSEPEMKTHLLLAHIENEISCPFCGLSGVSPDELEFHINTAHCENYSEPIESIKEVNLVEEVTHEHFASECNEQTNSPRTGAEEKLETKSSPRAESRSDSLPLPDEQMHSGTGESASKNACCVPELAGTGHSPGFKTGCKRELCPEKRPVYNMHCAPPDQEDACVSNVAEPHGSLECPFCGQKETSIEVLENHLKTHADLLDTPTKGNRKKKIYECPMCGLVCSDCQILQEHVDLHLEENCFAEGSSFSDRSLAKKLQDEENQRRRYEESRREQEEFQKLQRQYGLDKKGGYKQQSLRNMGKAVERGWMPPAEYHKRKVEMLESLASGADDGRTKTSGIMRALHELYQRSGRDVGRVWLCAQTDHFHSSLGDQGWGCGYRNFQMLLSSLLQMDLYKNSLKDLKVIPCIERIQGMIEGAWREGFDPQGASHFNNKLQGTRSWIGASEIYSLLSSLQVKSQSDCCWNRRKEEWSTLPFDI